MSASESLVPADVFALLDVDAKAAVDDLRTQCESLVAAINEHNEGQVHNLPWLTETLFKLRNYNDLIDATRKSVVESLKAGPNAIDTYCRDARKSVEATIAKAEESLEALMRQHGVGRLACDEGVAELKPVYEVTVEDMAKVPRQYLVPDVKMLEAAAAAGVTTIPGCTIKSASVLTTRRNARRKQ